ncbi:conserved hypothetical protein [Ricinus communis]|uniref:Uncharacterized protein n=1 Tax=Ricinus communis TaxID=3988 RepID=B9SZY0_RICCO|nr:conserved hypothetical protein [Ricinus communis]
MSKVGGGTMRIRVRIEVCNPMKRKMKMKKAGGMQFDLRNKLGLRAYRNEIVWCGRYSSIAHMKAKGETFLSNWQKAKNLVLVDNSVLFANPRVSTRWQCLSLGWVKINMDDGLFKSSQRTGMGSIAPDD